MTRKKLEGLAPRRKRCGLTQEALAATLGVPRATVASWEVGLSWPPARMLPEIAGALLCTVDELYYTPEEDAARVLAAVAAAGGGDG